MKDNPASQIRGYRCYVVSMVKSLKILDSRPVTSDERVNAAREITQVSKEVASVQLEVDKQRVIQHMLGRSPNPDLPSSSYPSYQVDPNLSTYRQDIYQNSSFMIEELDTENTERAGGQKSKVPTQQSTGTLPHSANHSRHSSLPAHAHSSDTSRGLILTRRLSASCLV